MFTILVIDDDEQMQHYLLSLLEQKYSVRQAYNGEEGIRSYQRCPTDLVLCDIFMESTNGLETIQLILQESPQAKIIAMSGGGNLFSSDFLYEAGQFGAVAALSKPFRPALLLQTIHDVLQEQGTERPR